MHTIGTAAPRRRLEVGYRELLEDSPVNLRTISVMNWVAEPVSL